jgi:hypothetical protein
MQLKHTSNYADRRRQEYPAIEEQLDVLYHDGYDAWKVAIAEIKARYPKPVDGQH